MFGSFTGPFSCLLVTEAEYGKWETSLRSLCSSVLVRSWWNGWCWYNIVAGKVTCQWLYCLCPLVQIHLYWMAKVSFLSIFLHYPIVMLVDTHLMAVFQDSWVSRFQIVSFLDCIGAKDDGGGGDNWSYETYYPTLSFSLILCLSVSLSPPLSPSPCPFKRPFSRWAWISRYQNVSIPDFIGVKGAEGSGSNCSYKTCKAPVKMSPPTNQHPVFYRLDALPDRKSVV